MLVFIISEESRRRRTVFKDVLPLARVINEIYRDFLAVNIENFI